jgi:hypothetical protein
MRNIHSTLSPLVFRIGDGYGETIGEFVPGGAHAYLEQSTDLEKSPTVLIDVEQVHESNSMPCYTALHITVTKPVIKFWKLPANLLTCHCEFL